MVGFTATHAVRTTTTPFDPVDLDKVVTSSALQLPPLHTPASCRELGRAVDPDAGPLDRCENYAPT